jgi:hypothetical protein
MPSRCGSLPVTCPVPADRSAERCADQTIGESAIALQTVILKPGRMPGGTKVFPAHGMMLPPGSSAQSGEEAFNHVRAYAILAIGFRVIDRIQRAEQKCLKSLTIEFSHAPDNRNLQILFGNSLARQGITVLYFFG